ncbi:hypothetical protein MY11210_007808 [Beauveria gryllotalpidicola]
MTVGLLELGHALHASLARTRWGDSRGYRVCLEFGKDMGTCMENFAWLEDGLESISCHYLHVYTDDSYKQAWMTRHPGQALPACELPVELISEKIARRSKNRIDYYLGQSADATFDLAVHNPKTHQDLEALDETKLFQDLEAQSKFTPAERSWYPQAAFSHLVSGYNSHRPGHFGLLVWN